MSRTLLRVRNVLKAWVILFGLCAVLGIVPLLAGDYRLLSIFLFCALLLAGAGYFYIDRIALGMVGARELPRGGQSGSGASQRLVQWRDAMFWRGIRMWPFSSMCATSSTAQYAVRTPSW